MTLPPCHPHPVIDSDDRTLCRRTLHPLCAATAGGAKPTVEVGDSAQAALLADPLEALSRRRQRGGGARRVAGPLAQAREQGVLPAKRALGIGNAQGERALERVGGLRRAAAEDLYHGQVVEGSVVTGNILGPVEDAAGFLAERARPVAVAEGRLGESEAGQRDGGTALVGERRSQVCG